MASRKEILDVNGREVTVSNPDKVFFPESGRTKLDLVRYYLTVADGVLRGAGGRPMALKRYVNGIEGEAFYQKRAPQARPDWVETAELRFPSGRTASEIVLRDPAQLAWVVNLGCVDLHPHPVRAEDLAHPDELRVDLDPVPGVPWSDVREVALVVREALTDFGLTGWPKTSGSRGFHVYCRIEPRWTFTEVRRAAVALAREVEARVPALATSRWWKEERHGVFVDYNQNAKDRTTASSYSIRPTHDARVSTPLRWDEVPDCEPGEFTLESVPARFAASGDPWRGIDDAAGSLDALLELAERHTDAGLADAPWPPHFAKQAGEPVRARPSKRRTGAQRTDPDVTAVPETGPDATAPVVTGADATGADATGPDATGPDATGPDAMGAVVTGAQKMVPAPAPGKSSGPTGRRRSSMPLIEIARAASRDEAMAGLERWKQRHGQVWPYLEPADVLVDSMRGRSSTWTRIRLNLRSVPAELRPPQEALEVDFDPWRGRSSSADETPGQPAS